MKRLIAAILAVLLTLSIMTGCGESAGVANEIEPQDRFQCVDFPTGLHDACIFVDMETGVLYLGNTSMNHTFMTVLLNTDGTPMIWGEWEK